jgi:hypothetical protein
VHFDGVEEMKEEPVAWSCWNDDMPSAIITFTEPDKYDWMSIKPLYTTPQTKPLSDEEIGIPAGLSDPKSYYQGYEDGVQSLTVTDHRPVAFMKDFGGFTDDPVLAIQDGFNIPVYVTKADYQKIKQKKPCDAPQTKRLSFDVMVELGKEVDAVWDVNINGSVWFPSVDAFESFCRAIEERHGIK